MINPFRRKKVVLEWNKYQQIIVNREMLHFISQVTSESLRNLSAKEVDEFGMFKKRARRPDEILKDRIRPVFF